MNKKMRSRVIFYKRESFKNSILNVCKIAAVNENVTDPQYQLRIIIYMPALHAILQEREGGSFLSQDVTRSMHFRFRKREK